MSIAGHVSQKMLQSYPSIRMQAKRHALDALDSSTAENGLRRGGLQHKEQHKEGFETVGRSANC
jgi:hypothetical protein